jgi:8-oxo-dGTP diphosphatase
MEKFNNRYQNINYCTKCGSKLTIKNDREDKQRPHCDNCGWIYYKNPVPAAACVILNENNQIVIIKRRFEPHAGEWALPSGYIEIDQTPAEAAVAEMYEETSLVGKVDTFLDYFVGSSPIYESIISFGFLMKVEGGSLQAGDDAVEARYVDIDKLPEIAFDSHKHYIQLATETLRKERKDFSICSDLGNRDKILEPEQKYNKNANYFEFELLTDKIIKCAIEVHKSLGLGLLEKYYEKAMCIALAKSNISYERQKRIPVLFQNEEIGESFADIVVENKIVLELKSVERFDPLHHAQLLSYLKLGKYKVGLLINFNSILVTKGIKRIIN